VPAPAPEQLEPGAPLRGALLGDPMFEALLTSPAADHGAVNTDSLRQLRSWRGRPSHTADRKAMTYSICFRVGMNSPSAVC
jgi:hypothetical protein